MRPRALDRHVPQEPPPQALPSTPTRLGASASDTPPQAVGRGRSSLRPAAAPRRPLGVVCLWDEHELENDRGLNFEDYRYAMNVRPYRTTDWARDQRAAYELTTRLFERLKATGRYRLLLVEELQKRVQEFDPHVA